MQSFNDQLSSDFSNIFEYSTQAVSSDPPLPEVPVYPSVNLTGKGTPSEIRSSPVPPADAVTDDDFFRSSGNNNNTQRSNELLYMVLGIVVGSLVLLVVIFTLFCRYRQNQLKKSTKKNFFWR